MPDYEEMPLPQKGDEDFPLWLVPARNNIQRQLLRVQRMLGNHLKIATGPRLGSHRESRGLGYFCGFSVLDFHCGVQFFRPVTHSNGTAISKMAVFFWMRSSETMPRFIRRN